MSCSQKSFSWRISSSGEVWNCILPFFKVLPFKIGYLIISSLLFRYSIFKDLSTLQHFKPPSDIWWAQMDSNHRPHAYQACALTTWAMRPTFWWRWGGSNSWPSACKADALPAELHPQLFLFQSAASTASSKLNNIQDDPCWPKFKAVSLYTP